MKTPYLFSKSFLCSLFIITLLISACKKDKEKEPAKAQLLIGSWFQTPVDANSFRTIFFNKNKTIQTSFVYWAAPSSSESYTGTYAAKGDSLATYFTERTSTQGDDAPVKTAITLTLFDSATYSFKNDTLIIDYLSYPADGPVKTQAKFLRTMND